MQFTLLPAAKALLNPGGLFIFWSRRGGLFLTQVENFIQLIFSIPSLKHLFTLVNYNVCTFIWITWSVGSPRVSSKQTLSCWNPSESIRILQVSKSPINIHFNETGGLFAIFTYRGGLLGRGLNRAFMVSGFSGC